MSIPQTEWEGLFQRFMLLEVSRNDRNHQLREDYRWWFAEWGDFAPVQQPHVASDYREEEDEEPEPPANNED